MQIFSKYFLTQGEILMLCKGAESHVLDRIKSGFIDKTRTHIDEYAEVDMQRFVEYSCFD